MIKYYKKRYNFFIEFNIQIKYDKQNMKVKVVNS